MPKKKKSSKPFEGYEEKREGEHLVLTQEVDGMEITIKIWQGPEEKPAN